MDSSGERTQCPSTKSRKCWAGPGGEQACGTDTEAFEQGKSKWAGLGALIITGTGKSRGYGKVHSRVGWRTMLCPKDANEQTAQAPCRGGLTDCCMMATPGGTPALPQSQDKTEPASPNSHLSPSPSGQDPLLEEPPPAVPGASGSLSTSPSSPLWAAGSRRTEALTVSKLPPAFQDLARRLGHICHRNE